MSAPAIPIENIYYLFCYAWNRFEQAQAADVGAASSPDLPNLLARVLLNGTTTILRRGLDRGYQLHEEDIATIKGRIELGATMQIRARSVRRVYCEFDELSHDLPHNQIIKASLNRLSRAATIDPMLAKDLQRLTEKMPDVSDIRLEAQAFARVQLHRNNSHYGFLLNVARLAFDCLLPAQGGQGYRFTDVLRDERKMAAVFEEFARNFYRTEQSALKVEPLTIAWDAYAVSVTGAGRLPSMRADVFLRGPIRRIIIDTKYYASALQSYHGSESFHSGNLYQLFSYLKNAAGGDPDFGQAEGILLYPTAGVRLRETFHIQGHTVTLATLDLLKPWRHIHEQLMELVA